jgi:hypothetical protein
LGLSLAADRLLVNISFDYQVVLTTPLTANTQQNNSSQPTYTTVHNQHTQQLSLHQQLTHTTALNQFAQQLSLKT